MIVDGYNPLSWEAMGSTLPLYTALLGYIGSIVGVVVFDQVHGFMVRPYLRAHLENRNAT